MLVDAHITIAVAKPKESPQITRLRGLVIPANRATTTSLRLFRYAPLAELRRIDADQLIRKGSSGRINLFVQPSDNGAIFGSYEAALQIKWEDLEAAAAAGLVSISSKDWSTFSGVDAGVDWISIKQNELSVKVKTFRHLED